MKASSLLIYLLIVSIISKPNEPPTEFQDADAAWLSNQIYIGVDEMDTDSGKVIFSGGEGSFAIWKQKYTGECYLVNRGTKYINDFFTDLATSEVDDEEIGVKVHYGVKFRGEAILSLIDDRLKDCTEDIIITGHSLGGCVSHYLFLKYVKRHYYEWGQKAKASRFKAVMFGAPQLITQSSIQLLRDHEQNINWYKYQDDMGPELIRTVKNSVSLFCLINIFPLSLAQNSYNNVRKSSYGDYIPNGYKYHLLADGRKEEYFYDEGTNYSISDHIDFYKTVELLTRVWYTKKSLNNKQLMDYKPFLKEENPVIRDNDNTIYINSSECENITEYNIEAIYQDVIFYMKNDTASYIIKRLLDNEKEYEYALCSENGFVLKQCNANCSCHDVLKNNRPKNISLCNTYRPESVMNCLVDGVSKRIELKQYFSLMTQRKIDDYYLMSYYCYNKMHYRGNYQNPHNDNDSNFEIKTVPWTLLILIIVLSIIGGLLLFLLVFLIIRKFKKSRTDNDDLEKKIKLNDVSPIKYS